MSVKNKKISQVLLELLKDGNLGSILDYPLTEHLDKDDEEQSKKIIEVANRMASFVEVIEQLCEKKTVRFQSILGPRDQVGHAMARLSETVVSNLKSSDDVKDALEEERNKYILEDWLKSKYTDIFSKIQGVKTIAELGSIVLSELSSSISAQVGVFFVKTSFHEVEKKQNHSSRDFKLYLASAYGVLPEQLESEIMPGEGIIGQVALDLKPRYLDDFPEDFFLIKSGLGSLKPKSLVIMPVCYQNELCGIIEVASLTNFTSIQKKLLEQVSNNIGISIKSIAGNMLTEKLLEELAQTNNSLASQKQALDNSAIVAETDAQGRITYVNEKFLEISKYSKEELIGQDHRILNSKYHPREFFIDLWKTIAKGEVWHGEVKNKTKEGDFYWVDTTIFPVRDSKGKLQKYVAIRFDITDKKRALEDLQIITNRATEAARVKSEFLANMSHEIRTPLNVIIGMGEMLRETPLNMEQENFVNVLNNSGNLLLDVINNVLDLSKIESGNIDLEKIEFDLEDVINSTSEIMSWSAQEKKLSFVVSIRPETPIAVIGDSKRIQQVITNFLSNAIKFTKEGEVCLTVEPDMTRKNWIMFTVTDTGIGVPSDKIDKLFRNFSQVNSSTTREYGGTGLGLALSKRIVEAMGGVIGFEPMKEKGSKFYFALPLPSYKDNKKESSDENLILKGKSVLLVGAASSKNAVLKEYLVSTEMKVLEAFNYDILFRVIEDVSEKKTQIDFVLIDRYKDASSIEIANRIRPFLPKETKIVLILNKHSERNSIGFIRESGISACIIKPVYRKKIIHLMKNLAHSMNTKPSVLVVDDDSDIREVISSSFELFDVNIIGANTCDQALKELSTRDFNLIISDLNMPERGGIEFVKEVKRNKKDIPVVIFTGYFDDYRDNLEELEDVECIDKGGDFFELKSTVDRLLENLILGKTEKHQLDNVRLLKREAKILIVDDLKENIELLKGYLKKSSCIVDTASSGQEALEKFSQSKYDLIFIDLQMPFMDGHETILRIRKIENEKKRNHTNIVVLSAHAQKEEMQKSRESGADDYLVKPIKKSSVLDAVGRYGKVANNKTGS